MDENCYKVLSSFVIRKDWFWILGFEEIMEMTELEHDHLIDILIWLDGEHLVRSDGDRYALTEKGISEITAKSSDID